MQARRAADVTSAPPSGGASSMTPLQVPVQEGAQAWADDTAAPKRHSSPGTSVSEAAEKAGSSIELDSAHIEHLSHG